MRGRSFARLAAVLAAAAPVCAAPVAAEQEPRPSVSREAAIHGGVLLIPGAIGRDVNRAGGDVLVARAPTAPLLGARFEVRTRVAGLGVELAASQRRVQVANESGVDFPNHGGSPALYGLEGRLYPLAGTYSPAEPYVSAGLGGAVVSVDLDNVNDQERYYPRTRSVGGGVKFFFDEGSIFVDVQYKRIAFSRTGPLHAFRASALSLAVGAAF